MMIELCISLLCNTLIFILPTFFFSSLFTQCSKNRQTINVNKSTMSAADSTALTMTQTTTMMNPVSTFTNVSTVKPIKSVAHPSRDYGGTKDSSNEKKVKEKGKPSENVPSEDTQSVSSTTVVPKVMVSGDNLKKPPAAPGGAPIPEIKKPKLAKGEKKTVAATDQNYQTLACVNNKDMFSKTQESKQPADGQYEAIPTNTALPLPPKEPSKAQDNQPSGNQYEVIPTNTALPLPPKEHTKTKDAHQGQYENIPTAALGLPTVVNSSPEIKKPKIAKGEKKMVSSSDENYQTLAGITDTFAKDKDNKPTQGNSFEIKKPKIAKGEKKMVSSSDENYQTLAGITDTFAKDKDSKPAQGNTFEIKRPTIAKGEKKMVSSSDENYQTLAGITDTFAKDKDAKPSPNNAPEIKRPKITRGENKMVSSSDENYQTLAGLTDVFAKNTKPAKAPNRTITMDITRTQEDPPAKAVQQIRKPKLAKGEKKTVAATDENYQTLAIVRGKDEFAKGPDKKMEKTGDNKKMERSKDVKPEVSKYKTVGTIATEGE